MNDLELLDAHGPAAAPLREDVLRRARVALLDEAAQSPHPRSFPRRITIGLVAAATAGAALLAPSLLGLSGSDAIALGPSDPLSFPLTPATVPAGLGEPIFELDDGFMSARYGARSVDGLTVTTNVEDEDFWRIPDDARTVSVSGHEATLYEGVVYGGTTTATPTVSVVWQNDNGVWTRVTGRGSYAGADRVESFAESLTERPQAVDLGLEVAPEGWSIDAYKEDRILMLSPDDGPEDVDLTVSLVDDPPHDFASAFGVQEVTTAQVNDADAQVGRNGEGWIVLASTTGGQAYSVSAPSSFTRDQVITVARGVTFSP